jgi:hypothetical protein
MHHQSQHVPDDDRQQAERAIVLHLLDGDHPRIWTPAELQSALRPTPALTVAAALAALERDGVVCVSVERISASRAARHLDSLDLIAA